MPSVVVIIELGLCELGFDFDDSIKCNTERTGPMGIAPVATLAAIMYPVTLVLRP